MISSEFIYLKSKRENEWFYDKPRKRDEIKIKIPDKLINFDCLVKPSHSCNSNTPSKTPTTICP